MDSSNNPHNASPHNSSKLTWIYTLYRAFVALILASSYFNFAAPPASATGSADSGFKLSLAISLYVCVVFIDLLLMLFNAGRRIVFRNYVILTDVVLLAYMTHLFGGLNFQLGVLLLTTVMASSIIVQRSTAIFYSLLIAVILIYQPVLWQFNSSSNTTQDIITSLMQVVSLVVISLLGIEGSARLRQYENLATTNSQTILHLQSLNQLIIDHITRGVLVLNQQLDVVYTNNMLRSLLLSKPSKPSPSIAHLNGLGSDVVTTLSNMISQQQSTSWLNADSHGLRPYPVNVEYKALKPQQDQDHLHVFFIENSGNTQQQAQQLKLMALGRLSASIAHEIRNPLSIIRQASDLCLEEGFDLSTQQQLIANIKTQTSRINDIIENVLSLTRQSVHSNPEVIHLASFVGSLVSDTLPHHNAYINNQISADLHIRFDRQQLEQVLVNLLCNSIGHTQHLAKAEIMLTAQLQNGRVLLDVVDNGRGVPLEQLDKVFEPFFTTEKKGSGLGLYLAKAFCESNGAQLHCLAPSTYALQGACFRIICNQATPT